MSPHSITMPGDSRLIVEESSPDCLRVRTIPVSTGLRIPAIAAYGVFMSWIIWGAGSKLATLLHIGAMLGPERQTAAASDGTASGVFSILMGLGVSTLFLSAICGGILWLACGYQRLHVQSGVLDFESRLGPLRLAHHRALLTEITGASLAEVGAMANDDVQATALVMSTPQWKVRFGVTATLPALQQILGELQRMKAEASAPK